MSQKNYIEQIKSDGWCLIEDVIPSEKVDAIRDSVYGSARQHCDPKQLKELGIAFVPSIINYNQEFAEYLVHPDLKNVAETLLGKFFRISFTSVIVNESSNPRGKWHSDWPFNQNSACHVPAPYPDCLMHLTTLWMLSEFTAENGGTLIVPGSHRESDNPTGNHEHAGDQPHPREISATGKAGSVLVFDSRLWHSTAKNTTQVQRVALAVRYAPWWLNVGVLNPDSPVRKTMLEETGASENRVPLLFRSVYENLPEDVQPLYEHWVEHGPDSVN